MAILVDPRSGQKYEFPDENEGAARQRFGFVSQEEHASTQAAEQLQTEHGGEKLETALGSAQQQAAKRLSQVSTLAGEVDAMGNPVETVAPVSPETIAATVPGLAGANSPELAAQQQANPISAGIGKSLPDLLPMAVAGAATGGVGSAVAGGLGASAAVSGVVGAATANAALSTAQEAEAAHEEHRPIDVENIGKNFAFGALLEAGGYGLAKGIGAALGSAERPIQSAVRSSIDRAGVAAEDLGDPAVLASARAETQAKIETTASDLASAAESVKPVVAGNTAAQRSAIRQVAELHSDIADDLESLVKRPRGERYQTLLDMRAAADSPRAQEALDNLVSDRSLWGDAAVDHGNTMQAVAEARAGGPEAMAEAARAIKDPTVQRLVADLDAHIEDMQRFQGHELFGEHGSTAGAADANFNASDYDKARSEILNNDKHALHLANESDAILKDASQNTARNIDTINDALHGDLSVGEKYHDWETEAAKWSPGRLDKQASWMDERLAQGKEAAAAIDAMKTAGYDGKSYAARIVDTINQTETRLASAETPLARAQVAENAKRAYDRLIAGLSKLPETALETPVKQRLVDTLMPLANDLRSGFEDAKLFGRKIANYQRASNAGYHKLIEPLMATNQLLTERTPPVFGEVGANARGNVAIQSKIENQLRSYLGGGTRTQDQLATAYEGVQEIITAKKAAGATPAQLGRLREVEKAIESLRDDQQLASVVRTSMKTAVEHGHGSFAGASPGATLGVGAAGHAIDAIALHALGMPIGRFVRQLEPAAARYLTGAAKGARKALGLADKIPEFGEQGSALRSVMDSHAQRYARSLSDLHGSSEYASETFGNNAPAYTAMLRKRGANLSRGAESALHVGTGPVPGGGSGSGAAGAPAANDIMTGTPGFKQAAQPASPVSLAGMTLKDLGALPFEEATDRASTIKGLRESPEFSETGRAPKAFDREGHERGITISVDPDDGSLHLVDGRHRFSIAREKDLTSVWGTVREAGSGKVLFRGDIPMKAPEARTALSMPPEASARGSAEVGALGAATAAGAAGLGGYKALQMAQEPHQDPDAEHAEYLAAAGARDTTATARALTDPAAAKDFARRSRGQPSTLELFQGDHGTIQQAFVAQRSKVEQMMRDPASVVDSLADAFGGLSPALRDQLAAKAMVIATYLHAELPPQRGVSVMRPNGLPPAPLEARAYALKYMTATQPSTAFDDAKRGQLRHEQVDTLKATWPEQYAELRQQTLTEMSAGKSTIVQRQRADLLFSFSSALDPAFSSRLSAAAQSARDAKPKATTGGAGSAPSKSRTTADLQPGGIAALSA